MSKLLAPGSKVDHDVDMFFVSEAAWMEGKMKKKWKIVFKEKNLLKICTNIFTHDVCILFDCWDKKNLTAVAVHGMAIMIPGCQPWILHPKLSFI